ncbi:phycobiliprotein lyase [Pseudanabaena biceps]|nr:phycobiliprotein lyase [Pseudanabaena biceps]
MDIQQFLELFVGRWRSQRSDHQFGQGNGSDTRSVIEITTLEIDAPDVVAICEKYSIDPQTASHPMRLTWEEESLSSNKPKGKALLVPVPNLDNANKGLILGDQGKGEYQFASDESLTINTVIDQGIIEERVWYGNPNLRFRVATLIQNSSNSADQCSVRSSKFYSEIRVAIPKDAPT